MYKKGAAEVEKVEEGKGGERVVLTECRVGKNDRVGKEGATDLGNPEFWKGKLRVGGADYV